MAKDISRKVTIYINGKEVENNIKSIQAAVRKLENEQKLLTIGSDEYNKKVAKIQELKKILKEQSAYVNELGENWKSATEKLANLSNIIMGIQTVFQMGDAAIGSLKDLAADAAALDDVYADVMKTTGLTKEQVLQLNESFKKMDTRTSREQLNQLAYEAGKLGINSKEAVQQFVSASDKINIALGDVLGEGAMVEIGKLTNIYESVSDTLDGKNLEQKMLAIGSAVNSLGQASTANEGYMVDFMKRMGGIAAQAGLSADQVLGFASALDQNGQAVEMSATATMKLIQQMVKKPEEFVHAAGVSIEEFRRMMDEDMNGAMLRVLEGMNNDGGFQQLVSMFADMGLDGARAATVVSALAKHIDQVREAQALANREMLSGTSVINEFNTKNDTMQAQAEKAKKKFQDMRIELGEQLYPVLIHLTKSATMALKGFSGLLSLWKDNRGAAISLAGGIATLTLWLTRSQLAQLKDNIEKKKGEVISRLRSISIKQEAAAIAKATAAEEAERLAYFKSRLEEEKKILTDRTMQYTEEGLTRQTLAQAEAERFAALAAKQQTIATNAATAATVAQKEAFAATPWGVVIAAVTALAVGVAKLVKHQNRFNRETREANKELARESVEANYLFDKLDTLDKGTEEYRSTLDKLNQLYPDVLAKYTDENGLLTDSIAARQAVIGKLREEIAERRRLATMSDIEEKLQDKLGKHQEKLRKKVKSQQQYNDIMSAFSSGDVAKAMSLAEKVSESAKDLVFKMDMARRGAAKEIKQYDEVYEDFKKSGYGTAGSPLPHGREYGEKSWQTGIEANKSNNASSNSPSGGLDPENIVPDPGKANDNLDKWKSVASAAEDLITEFRNKALTGAEEIYASIDARTNDMLKKIQETVGATKEEKDTLAKTLTDAASAYKKAKLDEYLDKYRSELQKAAADPSGNELIDKINQVAESLRPYNEKIRQLEADQQALAGTDKEAADRIADLIQQYEALKTALADRAYLAIDTSVDTSDFALTGDRFADDKKYNEYTQAIERSRVAATRLLEVTTDPAQRAELEAQIEDLGLQQQNLDNIYKGFDDFEKKIKKSKALDNFINSFQTFGDKALEIFGSINQILDNISNRELRKQEELKDQNIKLLDDQLSQQLISQEAYDQRKAAIDEEYSAKQKEIELEQWRREKWLNASEAAMASALAILRVWSDAGNGSTAMRAAQTAVVGAATLAQMIAIASEPEPYAHGGYVNADTVFRAGEAGSEWIAPHRLLTDPVTAPVIQSLEDYRRGRVSLAAVNMPAVNAASSYLQDHNIDKQLSLLNSQFSLLAKYLSDPRNRQAVISRKTQEDFDHQEQTLRNFARL